jgi:hypothetical protein
MTVKIICQTNGWHQATLRNAWFYDLGLDHRFVQRVNRLNLRRRRIAGRRFGESGLNTNTGTITAIGHARDLMSLEKKVIQSKAVSPVLPSSLWSGT